MLQLLLLMVNQTFLQKEPSFAGHLKCWHLQTLRSPDTMKNLQSNSFVEINVIDPLSRKGYLFKGQARIVKDNSLHEEILNHYKKMGIKSPINSIVLVDVSDVSEVISPSYDMGISEQEIRSKWKKHFESLWSL